MLNIGFAFYFMVSGYQWYMYRNVMSNESLHHFWSHNSIVIMFTISINFWIHEGSWIALVFVIASFIYLLQHIMKENYRLIHYSRWTKDIEKDTAL